MPALGAALTTAKCSKFFDQGRFVTERNTP
jgi:hypothetical protein